MKILHEFFFTPKSSAPENSPKADAKPTECPPEESATEASPFARESPPRAERQKCVRLSPRVFSSPENFPPSRPKPWGPDVRVQGTLGKVQAWLDSVQDVEADIRIPSNHLEDLSYLLPDAAPEAQLDILNALDALYALHPRLHIASKKSFEKLAVPALTALISLTQADLAVRKEAIALLGRFAPRSSAAIDPLIRGLRDSHPEIRSACLRALGAFREKWDELLDEDILKMIEDPLPAVRGEALRTLQSLERTSPQAMRAVMSSLEDAHPGVRLEGLTALRELFSVYLAGDEFLDAEEVEIATELLNALYPLLNDSEESVRARTVWVLRDFHLILSLPAERVGRMIRVRGQKYPDEAESLHRQWARIQGLSVGLIEYLRREQFSKNPDLSAACFKLLEKLGAPYEADISKQSDSLDSTQASTVLETLKAIQSWGLFSSTAYGKVLPWARHQDPEIRAEAATTLAAIDPQRSLAALAKAHRDPDPQVRRAVATALGGITGQKNGALDILSRLKEDSSAEVRAAALRSLGNHAFDPEVLAILLEAYADKSAAVRHSALQASRGWVERLGLEDFEKHRLELRIVRLFSDPDAEVRRSSLELFFACYDLMPDAPRFKASILRIGQEDPDPAIRSLIEVHSELFFDAPDAGRSLSFF